MKRLTISCQHLGLAVALGLLLRLSDAFLIPGTSLRSTRERFMSKDNNDLTGWSDFAELPDDDESEEDDSPKLGIDLNLDPLTPEEALSLKAEATELINDKIAQGMDDISKLRQDLKAELEDSRKMAELESQFRTQKEEDRLLSKIDKMTDRFLEETQAVRSSTKLAAIADRSMEGKGVTLGSWGVVGGGAEVVMGRSLLLGSVEASKTSATLDASDDDDDQQEDDDRASSSRSENRIVVIADEMQDKMAKKLLPLFSELLQDVLPGVDIQTVKPTATMPLGADNAACVVVFATSLTEASSLKKMYDRLLRRILLPNGKMGQPPTQLICISTLGTERTNKFPYSMQNLMGGPLDKRRQIEEVVMNTVQQRVTEPALDYTVLKFGELQDSVSEEFSLLPGDALDGATEMRTAAHVLLQAVALQPAARNATLCATGSRSEDSLQDTALWEDDFLKLDGPELLRIDDPDLLGGDASKFVQLVEYMNEWGLLMESGKKALTTPIRVEPSARLPYGNTIKERSGIRLLFLPTQTGRAYMSREEERVREQEGRQGGGGGAAARVNPKKKEGGIEVLVEVTAADQLRVRARRCNMADDTVVKELSEETILKRLQDSINVWNKQL